MTPGSVVEFINIDLVDHGAVGTAWDSGLLATGASYKVKLTQNGSFAYGDITDANTQGIVQVSGDISAPAHALFLPIVQR
ncbi:MAG: hypothetical protein R2932_33240 [Caldilineaceae bacterium]